MTNKQIIAMVIAKAGGMHALGRMLGISWQAFQKWEKIPPKRVIELEAILDIPREKLRPDLYPPPREFIGLK